MTDDEAKIHSATLSRKNSATPVGLTPAQPSNKKLSKNDVPAGIPAEARIVSRTSISSRGQTTDAELMDALTLRAKRTDSLIKRRLSSEEFPEKSGRIEFEEKDGYTLVRNWKSATTDNILEALGEVKWR